MFCFEYVYSYAPMRSHGISQCSFLVYLLGLRNRVTVTFWTSLPLANLSAYYAFVPSFCPSGYDFAIPSSRLHLAMQTLGVAFGLVGNYLPVDFHHRALTCPSYQKPPNHAPIRGPETLCVILRAATKKISGKRMAVKRKAIISLYNVKSQILSLIGPKLQ